MTVTKIVSGGQTGVDRGALDAALFMGFPCGGWCPEDRGAEDGPIPLRYPLRPVGRGGNDARTRKNVIDSDATVILFDSVRWSGALAGGTLLTRTVSEALNRPHLVIDAATANATEAAERIVQFAEAHRVRVLNVAGPRASEWPQGYAFALASIAEVIRRSVAVR
jgi:Circularly permutated YpsA SLOG family